MSPVGDGSLTKRIRTEALLTCPECGHRQEAEMSTNACQHFFICINCKTVLSPKEGDCCVVCSYADVPCPPRRSESASGPQDR